MTAFAIREARLPEDRDVILSFIDGLQRYEHAIEPDRRVDETVAADYYAELVKRVAENEGRIFMAELDGAAVGWSVFHKSRNMIFVIEEERCFGYVAELFVNEAARGRGIGRALIEECEKTARTLGLKLMQIGVLAKNERTARVYAEAGYEPYSADLRKYLR